MVLMVSLSSRISPVTVTVIFFARLPLAMAVDTSAMLRTCAVRFDAIELTLSVKSFQAPGLAGEGIELVDHGIHGLLEFEDFPRHIDRDLARQVAACDGGGHLRD